MILDLVCRITGLGFAAIARVTETRWIACSVKDEISFGLKPGDELDVATTICNEIREHRTSIAFSDAANDPHWSKHPTPAKYGIRSYVSVPITLSSGEFFGTLCAIDPKPSPLDSRAVLDTFKLLAELIALHLEMNTRLETSEAALLDEREVARLREQFIAVLGHDLRSPLSNIAGTAAILERTPLEEPVKGLVTRMHKSVRRMAGLIDNLLDFARGRLGGGFVLNLSHEPLTPALEQVVAELRMGFPERPIETRFDLPDAVSCDRARIAQLFSNLLGNALTYGKPDEPVQALACAKEGWLQIDVVNAGDPITPETSARLFSPFARGEVTPNQGGLGLGLYIASEIARAHRGTLKVQSTVVETRFTLCIPIAGIG
ncbi:MAG: GAF domain-containing sensor histidine kinase [Steroidobacteraceae bacterium]|nr:GAF domain-containing sensor histidine kinase [Steroidobacteraceae bacterium]